MKPSCPPPSPLDVVLRGLKEHVFGDSDGLGGSRLFVSPQELMKHLLQETHKLYRESLDV